MLEIHAVDAGNRGRHGENGGPGGELAGDVRLLHLSDHQPRLEREGEHLTQSVDLRLDTENMVGDVAEVRLHHRIDWHHIGVLDPAAHVDQRPRRIAQPQQIAAQQIQPIDIGAAEAFDEDAILDAFDLLGDGFEHRCIIVDDKVEDGIENIVLAVAQRLRRRLAAIAHQRI